jgi:hypothetical protein
MDRRAFLASTAAAAAPPGARFRKSICSVIFPQDMPHAERFRRARQAGFEGMKYGWGTRSGSNPRPIRRSGWAMRLAKPASRS